MIKHQTEKYSLEIDERKGCVTSLCIDGEEYAGKDAEAMFQLHVRDENLMMSLVTDACNGELIEKRESGVSVYLRYGGFHIPGLEVRVYIELEPQNITWDIDVEEDDRYYVEWIDFPRVSVPNKFKRKSGWAKQVWNFDGEPFSVKKSIHRMMDGQQTSFDYSSIPSLCELHKDYFHVATAVEPRDLIHYKDLVLTQFNELTSENRMKPVNIHPSEDVYSWTGMDKIVEFAEEHNMRVRGHGLVYEKTFPAWFFKDKDGKRASRELVLSRLEKHVKTIVGRYKGRIHSYDVVNELFGHEDWDTRELTAICGIGYVPLVFKWAHEADPDAILILNDNYHDIPKKRRNIYEWVKKWIDEGAPIHGVGFQDHLFMDTSLEAVEETLKLFNSVPNFKLYITELDISMYKFEDVKNVYPDYMLDEMKELMAKKYGSLFDLYRKYSASIETVGFWNVCSGRTWLDEYYVKGRKHYPLPFGYEGEPNESFWRIADFEKKLPRWTKNTKIPEIRRNNYTIDEKTDTLTLKGKKVYEYETCENIDVKLFSDFGEKRLLAAFTDDIGEEFEYELSLKCSGGEDVSPDYVLEVIGNDGVVRRDRFTYFKSDIRDGYYTVTDGFYDFSKTCRAVNCITAEDGEAGRYAKPLWFWSNGTFGGASVVYSVPSGFDLSAFEIDMFTQNDKCFKVFVSSDDEEYVEADMKWKQKAQNGKRQYFNGALRNISAATRYIKIDLSKELPTYWGEYYAGLCGVKLLTNKA